VVSTSKIKWKYYPRKNAHTLASARAYTRAFTRQHSAALALASERAFFRG